MRFTLSFALLIALTAGQIYASELSDSLKRSLDSLNTENCSEKMMSVSKLLDEQGIQTVESELKDNSHEELLDKLWDYKIKIHEKMREIYKDEELSKDCATGIRHAFRSVRYAEDVIHDHNYRLKGTGTHFPDNAFEPGNLQVRRHPKYSEFNLKNDLRSGDLILSRGNAYTSAAISSLGEFDTQFSHVSVVYRDEKNELWTVEAHIEVGSIVRPIQEHIDDKNFRSMIYRFDDEAVAAKAAKFIFEKVKKASETTGNILYDFGFNPDENSKLFCSEVVSYAYDQASGGTIKIPLFRSRLLERKQQFVKSLEIEVNESFIPADLEVDPRFTVIAEWRDPAKVQDILEKDALIQAMYRWNDELGYRMIQSSSKKSLLYRNVAWPLRRVPYLKKNFVKKLPINMSRKLIGYFGVLESIGELMQKELKSKDDDALKSTGFPLLKSDQYKVLDDFRLKDLSAKKKRLHKMYRPQK
jgi:hypothetical protein